MEYALGTLTSLLTEIPLLLVWLTGLSLALIFWKRHPRVSLITVIAIGVFLVITPVEVFLNLWLPLYFDHQGMGFQQIALIYNLKAILQAIISAGLWTLVLAAIFGWRKHPAVESQTTN